MNIDLSKIEPPKYDISELNYICSSDLRKTYDSRHVVSRILDGSQFHEYKKEYGSTLLTGFGKIYGQEVGIVANNGILFPESAQKGANFI